MTNRSPVSELTLPSRAASPVPFSTSPKIRTAVLPAAVAATAVVVVIVTVETRNLVRPVQDPIITPLRRRTDRSRLNQVRITLSPTTPLETTAKTNPSRRRDQETFRTKITNFHPIPEFHQAHPAAIPQALLTRYPTRDLLSHLHLQDLSCSVR